MASHLLLVTDRHDHCRQIVDILSDFSPLYCTSKGAVHYCTNHPIRVAIVSEELDGTNGIALFEKLKDARPGVLGLLIASQGEPSTHCLAAMESGFSGLLGRPLDEALLRERVSKAMETATLREENTRINALLPLYGLGERFLSSSTQEQVLDSLLDIVAEQTAPDTMSVMLYNEEEGFLRIAASRGIPETHVKKSKVRPGDKIAGWVFANREPVILNQETQDDSPFAYVISQPDIVSAVSFPMIVRNHILGVLNVSHKHGNIRFASSDIEIFGILCNQASLALENVWSIASIAEKTRLQTLLEQYVAPEVAQVLIQSDADLTSGLGEVKKVTVLFADLRNFTGMVQQLSLQVMRDFLNDFFKVFTETIFEHRGTVDKFMGDAVLTVFGALIELENASYTAVETALDIQIRFAELKERWQEQDPFFATIDLGMGLTSGEMFMGNVGSSRRLDYTVIGTEVNISQRLASMASDCSIYITDEVRSDLKDVPVIMEDVGEMKLKGVKQPVQTFTVQGIDSP